jgi:predicted dithiol-disulfide oxidoreductase (DUF899 family)
LARNQALVEVSKHYSFEAPAGKLSLADLFDGRRQLIIYHFMYHRDRGVGCPGCSHMADNIPHVAHLHARDTSFTLVSRAPFEQLERFKQRMGWSIPWCSSFDSDFNYDFHATTDEAVAPLEYNYMDKGTLELDLRALTIAVRQLGDLCQLIALATRSRYLPFSRTNFWMRLPVSTSPV